MSTDTERLLQAVHHMSFSPPELQESSVRATAASPFSLENSPARPEARQATAPFDEEEEQLSDDPPSPPRGGDQKSSRHDAHLARTAYDDETPEEDGPPPNPVSPHSPPSCGALPEKDEEETYSALPPPLYAHAFPEEGGPYSSHTPPIPSLPLSDAREAGGSDLKDFHLSTGRLTSDSLGGLGTPRSSFYPSVEKPDRTASSLYSVRNDEPRDFDTRNSEGTSDNGRASLLPQSTGVAVGISLGYHNLSGAVEGEAQEGGSSPAESTSSHNDIAYSVPVRECWKADILSFYADPGTFWDAFFCPCILSSADYDGLFHPLRVQDPHEHNYNCLVAIGLCCLTCGSCCSFEFNGGVACLGCSWCFAPSMGLIVFVMRQIIRSRYGIQGNFYRGEEGQPPNVYTLRDRWYDGVQDFLLSCYCMPCTLAQQHRELVLRGAYRGRVVFGRSDRILEVFTMR